ncbi:MAG: DUF1269 domain-containing protein [Thermoanaerobaculia bacterium]
MSDLIVAGFNDAHTAFLARAALARLQGELSLPGHDLAVVTKEEGGETTLREAVSLSGAREMHPTFWKTLVSLLFAPGPSTGAGSDATSAKLAAIGIDATFRSRLAEQVQAETSAVLVLVTGPAMRDRVLGVLRGFQGETMLTELTGGDREVWLCILLGTEQLEKTK